MNTVKTGKAAATLELDFGDLAILNNALNEVTNGLSLNEFETRMGAGRDEVLSLLDKVHDLLNQMKTIDAA